MRYPAKVCPKCRIVTSHLGDHLERKRCRKQHIRKKYGVMGK
jgi:hypothetical protein